ncbi:MAG: S-layer homology domain-containing protein [Thermoleophilia bacterium]|nr:S-layer homology domain-containing protein [Thermoleophilia bacterium]
MVKAATGSNHEERHLTQPPRGFRGTAPRGRGLHYPVWVAAVLLVAALSLLIFPMARGEAAMLPEKISAAASDSVVVPILFPLEERVKWTDTFGAPRSGGRTHEGQDLMAPKMTPILAVVDGTVDWLNMTGQLSSYNNLPYYNILLRGDDGNDYFYIHLNNDTPGTDDAMGGVQHAYAPGLKNGSRVETGDVIGYVGDSGNAEDCGSHLHFEIHLGGYKHPVNPHASLKAAPTLAEWVAAGRPPLAAMITGPGSDGATTTTTTTKPPATTTTTEPLATTTTTTTKPPTTSTTPGGAAVPGFTDVVTNDWFYNDFAIALDAGVVTEAADQRFRPYSQVSRALFAVYLVRTLATDELDSMSSAAASGPTFDDVDTEYWAFEEIEVAARLGLVMGTGDGSRYSPESKVTRAQMATMICRALGLDVNGEWIASPDGEPLYKDIPADYWAHGAIFVVDYYGLMCGDANGCFRPLDNTTRAQAITVMARILRLLEGA